MKFQKRLLMRRQKTAFAEVADSLETQTEYISQTLQNVFDFMEAAFGDSQEMVAFITELNANYYSLWFIRENGSDQYIVTIKVCFLTIVRSRFWDRWKNWSRGTTSLLY